MQQYTVSQSVRTIAMGIWKEKVFTVPECENVLLILTTEFQWFPQTLTIHSLDYISYIPGSDVVMLAKW